MQGSRVQAHRRRIDRRDVRLITAIILLLTGSSSAFAADPLKIAREFCRLDGLGRRLEPQTLRSMAPLVAWPFEPAWDRVLLARGYEISTPRYEGENVALDVTYTVVAEVRAGKVKRGEWLDVQTLRMQPIDDGKRWVISGPPPVPHLFESRLESDALAKALDPEAGGFPSNSAVVWNLFREEGGTLPYMDTLDLATASSFMNVTEPSAGDAVFYFQGENAYHVGYLVGENQVISATLNSGIVKVPIDAFAGEVRFRRSIKMTVPAPAESDSGKAPTSGTAAVGNAASGGGTVGTEGL